MVLRKYQNKSFKEYARFCEHYDELYGFVYIYVHMYGMYVASKVDVHIDLYVN